MFKRALQVGILLLAGSIAMPSWAISIVGGTNDGTDVGVVDDLLAQDDMQGNSNTTTETEWVNLILADEGLDPTTYTIKIEENIPYYSTDTANTFAVSLNSNEPDYFLVKNSTRVALYSNNDLLEWGVFDASLLTGFNIPSGEMTISHVTLFGGCGDVPEPGVLGLLGIGLLGIVLGRRRMAA